MAADQAAGLRRHAARRPLRAIHCFFDTTGATDRLAHALHRLGWTALLVDAGSRAHDETATRSLFSWQQQLARMQLHLQPTPYGERWSAPGLRADEPALATVARGYDCLLFEACLAAPDWAPLRGAVQHVLIEANDRHDARVQGFALLKTLSRLAPRLSVGLCGNAASCVQLQAACERFLDPAFARRVYNVAGEDDGFAALAVRMAGEETTLAGSL